MSGNSDLGWEALDRRPVSEEDDAASTATAGDSSRRQGVHVLLVEDQAVNQAVVKAMLGALGAEVTVAGDGPGALRELDTHRFDLVLMDCVLPVIDGWEVSRRQRLREQAASLQRTPIIALTAGDASTHRGRCLAAGMSGFLAKPVGLEALREAWRRWIPEHPPAAALGPGRTGEPAGEALDPDTVASINSLEPAGTGAFFESLRESYLRCWQRDVRALEAALADARCTEAAKLAHRMKSSCSAIGAHRLAELCGRTEQAALDGGLDPAHTALLRKLHEEHRRVGEALDLERGRVA